MPDMLMREIRCPSCHRLQGKAWLVGISQVEFLCRCKTKMLATKDETVVVTVAASVSRTFDGRYYLNGMVMT